MKTKITLLLFSIALLSFSAIAGVDSAISEKEAAQKQAPVNHSQLRHLQQGTATISTVDCGTSASYTDSIFLPDNDPIGVSTVITVSGISGSNLGSDVYLTKIHVSGHHSYVGDLILSITAPNGASVLLLNRPGYPVATFGCQYDNYTFDVVPGMGADNENTCIMTGTPALPGEYGIAGVFSAISGFDLDTINLAGGDPNGAWTFFGSDNANADVGAIDTVTFYFSGSSSIYTYTITGATIDFSGPTTGGTTLSWDFGDGNSGTGTSPSNTYPAAGSYAVSMFIATATDTCVTTRYVMPDFGVGVPSISGSNNFMIFPNPSSGSVDISLKNVSSRDAEMIVYDSFGRTLKIQALKPGAYHQSFDISSWSKGVYYVKVIDQDATNIQKLILN